MRRRRPLVLLDVDGVIADFLTPAHELACAITNVRRDVRDLRDWSLDTLHHFSADEEASFYAALKAPGFHNTILPYSDAAVGVRALQNLADVHIVTSPIHGQTWCAERWDWLEYRFGIDPKDVTFTSEKSLVEGDAIIDDHPRNVNTWHDAHPNAVALLWGQPYNEAHYTPATRRYRVNGWAAAIKQLAKHFGEVVR